MKRSSYSCDICGVERKEANHWFMATKDAVCLSIESWDAAEIENWLDNEDALHLCGQVCAHKLLDRFLAEATKTVNSGQQTVDSETEARSTTSTKGEDDGKEQSV